MELTARHEDVNVFVNNKKTYPSLKPMYITDRLKWKKGTKKLKCVVFEISM